MTTLYVAMIDDRHANTEPEVFTTAEQAIAYAKGWAEGAAHQPDDFEEPRCPKGWLYYATYSPESDAVWVVAKVLDDPDAEVSSDVAEPKPLCNDLHTEPGMKGFYLCRLDPGHDGDHASGSKTWPLDQPSVSVPTHHTQDRS
jgi:hypothetical protein